MPRPGQRKVGAVSQGGDGLPVDFFRGALEEGRGRGQVAEDPDLLLVGDRRGSFQVGLLFDAEADGPGLANQFDDQIGIGADVQDHILITNVV